MQVKTNKGRAELSMVRADASLFMQTKYLLDFVARNSTDKEEKSDCQKAASFLHLMLRRYGEKYLDVDGNLKESERTTRQNESAPSK